MQRKHCFTLFFLIIPLFIVVFASPAFSQPIEKSIEQARQLLKSGQNQKAAELLNNLLTSKKKQMQNHPRHAETWYFFSVALDRLGRKQLAQKALDRARKIKQSQQQTVSTSSQTQTELTDSVENDSEAVSDETEEITSSLDAYSLKSLKNEDAKEHYRKGAVYEQSGHLQSAVDSYLKAIESEPDNKELIAKTCEVIDETGGNYYQKAQKLYIDLEKLDKDGMTATQKAAQARANILSGKPDLKKAEAILATLLEENEKNVEAIVLSAQLDTVRKQFDSATSKFAKAKELDKNNLPAYLGLGECYLEMEKLDKAIEVLSKAREIWPDSFRPLVALGKAYLKNEDYGSALLRFKEAFAIDSGSFEVNLGLLEIFVKYNDTRFDKHLQICEQIYKGDPRVEYLKAISFELRGKLIEAQKIYSFLAYYDDETAKKSKIRLGELYSGQGHKTFPGSELIKNRPLLVPDYLNIENPQMAFNYYSAALDHKPDKATTARINHWLDENEERVREALRFESRIQSLFRR